MAKFSLLLKDEASSVSKQIATLLSTIYNLISATVELSLGLFQTRLFIFPAANSSISIATHYYLSVLEEIQDISSPLSCIRMPSAQ